MNYDGIELDVINLGNADSILATQWTSGVPCRVLVDGGNPGDDAKVLSFLRVRGIKYLDHIVCSHPHEDHAGGLIGIVKSPAIDFGQAWIHLPWKHIDQNALSNTLIRSEASAKRAVKIIRDSLQIGQDLVAALTARKKPIQEPFARAHIGFLFVCGPSQQFYEGLLRDFADFEKLKGIEESINAYELQGIVESLFEGTILGRVDSQEATSGLGQAPTEPENNSSTILWAEYSGQTLLLTADAGVEALTAAKQDFKLSNVTWMQIPHHGSRRNVTEELINYFKPKLAWVSADGTKKHPRRAVVNAFKATGAKVFSTHYPPPDGGHKWFHLGTVPNRPNYTDAVALYDADT